MPMYATTFRYQPAALKLMVERPEDRGAIVGEAAKSLGGRVVGYYWSVGDFDGLVIFELPDGDAAAAVQMVMAGTGAVSRVQTNEIFPADTLQDLLKETARVAYAPPGG
jgi:uncharacterized protein with GYD domain